MNLRPVRQSVLRSGLNVALAGLLAGAGIAGLYWPRYHAVSTLASAAIEPPVITVTAAPAEVRPLTRSVIGDGSVVAWRELMVGAEVGGLRGVDVTVDEGDQVRRGQVLMRFDVSLLNAQVAQAEAGIAEAEAALRFLHTDVTRAIELSHGAFIATQTLEQRQSAARQAEARLVLAHARHEEAIARLAQARLVAPPMASSFDAWGTLAPSRW